MDDLQRATKARSGAMMRSDAEMRAGMAFPERGARAAGCASAQNGWTATRYEGGISAGYSGLVPVTDMGDRGATAALHDTAEADQFQLKSQAAE